MKKVLLLFAGIFSALFLYSQPPVDEGWVEIGNAAYNSQLYDIEFISQTTGFAVGNGGAFLKTTDGGQTWTAYNIGVNYALLQIQFTSPTNGYIRGGNKSVGQYFGKILHTTDGGNTWNEVHSENTSIKDLYFINDSTGFLSMNAKILKTTDYGQTWITYNQPSTVYDVYKVRFGSSKKGAYIHNGYNIYLTEDAGVTWNITYTITGQYPKDLCYVDGAYAYSIFGTRLYASSDTGVTWTYKNDISSAITKINFYSELVGYGYGDKSNTIYKTNDGGTNFSIVFNGIGAGVTSIKFMPNGDVVAVGRGGLVLHSANGTTWDTLHVGTFVGNLKDIVFVGNDTGFAVGTNGNIKKTINGGITWETQNLNTNYDLNGISYFSTDDIFIAGDNNALFHSSDTGKTWNALSGPSVTQKGILMTDQNEGFIYGSRIIKTNDNGNTWNNVVVSNCFSACNVNSDISFFGGSNEIKYTLDGGISFSTLTVSRIIYAIYFFNADTGIYINHWGEIYKTENRGTNWVKVKTIEACDKADFYFIDDTTGYVVLNLGSIYKTTDAGNTWTKIYSGTMRDLTAIHFTTDGTGFIVGDDGMILRKAVIPTYGISFEVINDEGDTLTNATMNFNGSTFTVGEYSVAGLEAFNYSYTFTCPGHQSFSGFVDLTSDTTITVELKKYHQVKVEVTNAFTIPVENANVMFGSNVLQTNVFGIVEFNQILKSTNNTLLISNPNYKSFTSVVDVIADTVISVVLDANLDAPVAENATGVDEDSFTAHWQSVANADDYILFISDDNFVTHLLGFDFFTLNDTSFTIDNLESGHLYYYRLKSVNQYGYSDYSNIIQVTTNDISGISMIANNDFMVMPNPANSFITIEGNKSFGEKIVVSDVTGRVVISEIFKGEKIDVTILPSGIYFITIGDKAAKFVKE